jgi:hypothetical protein
MGMTADRRLILYGVRYRSLKKKWKPSIGFPKKEHKKESITQCSLFFSAKPACSLRFSNRSHAGKT